MDRLKIGITQLIARLVIWLGAKVGLAVTMAKPSPGKQWLIEAPASTLTNAVNDSTLVLRLGVAVDAIRAAQRFFPSEGVEPGPAGERDRLWAFLIAMGFLHEALQVPGKQFARFIDLAKTGGASPELMASLKLLKGGASGFARQIADARNQIIFHWDEDPFRAWINSYSNATVTWAEGASERSNDSIYRASNDAVAATIAPGESAHDIFRSLVNDLNDATETTIAMFEHAIGGHLTNQRVPPRKR